MVLIVVHLISVLYIYIYISAVQREIASFNQAYFIFCVLSYNLKVFFRIYIAFVCNGTCLWNMQNP